MLFKVRQLGLHTKFDKQIDSYYDKVSIKGSLTKEISFLKPIVVLLFKCIYDF